MLKSHSRLVENLALAGDLLLIAACWIGSYGIRFYLLPVTDVPPFRDYALQLVPILLVWGIAFRTFDLYRPNRLGSRRSEWWDVAKASTLGALVLVSIMTFVFRGYEYSRLVIILFLAQSIVVVSLARAGLREVLRFARRPGYHLRESRLYGWNRVVKRVFDLVFGALALAVAAPLMLAIAVALKLTSSGAVLYRQERMGVDGRRFRMLKFRTMQVNAEAATGPVWARADDPRRTPLGVFLRRTSLDELPQLFNVLRGEMSLVGPRPERPSFVEEFRRRVPGYMLRHKMKAGITGWAQINGWRGNTSIEKRIEHDLYYIERWSLAFDLKILLQTLWYGFRVNRNAH